MSELFIIETLWMGLFGFLSGFFLGIGLYNRGVSWTIK